MGWVRLDDAIYDHPKFDAVPKPSRWVWICSLAYANRHLTDGFIPSHALRRINGSSRDAGELVTAGLWLPDDGGWEIHDYLEHQRSREQIESERLAIRRRVDRWRRNGRGHE